jgi:hypothetical protein
MRAKYYVGMHRYRHKLQVFSSATIPTVQSHGIWYKWVWGKFKTKRAAEFAAKYGLNNPHCITVADAERLAKEAAQKEKVQCSNG